VSPRKVSSGGAVSIQSRPVKDIVPLARLELVRVPFALYGLPNRPVPPAGELSGSDRATRCPTEELRDGPYGAGCPAAFKPARGNRRRGCVAAVGALERSMVTPWAGPQGAFLRATEAAALRQKETPAHGEPHHAAGGDGRGSP
jgi:hypothetical protein